MQFMIEFVKEIHSNSLVELKLDFFQLNTLKIINLLRWRKRKI